MIYNVSHRLEFRFSEPVFFEPLTVRLQPRSDASQIPISHHLETDPNPDRWVRSTGLEGNFESVLWFSGRHGKLVLQATSRIRTIRTNPFDFLLTDKRSLTFPYSPGSPWSVLFSPYLETDFGRGPAFMAFAEKIRTISNSETVPFLTLLGQEIHDSLSYIVREEGPPRSPEETLRHGSGSCRDFALLAMEVCRFFGIPARFTSGYHLPPLSRQSPSLHAWVEVYLPGAGWLGIDPSEGVMAAEHHISLVSSPVPYLTLPTEGTFRGNGASTLFASIEISPIEG